MSTKTRQTLKYTEWTATSIWKTLILRHIVQYKVKYNWFHDPSYSAVPQDTDWHHMFTIIWCIFTNICGAYLTCYFMSHHLFFPDSAALYLPVISKCLLCEPHQVTSPVWKQGPSAISRQKVMGQRFQFLFLTGSARGLAEPGLPSLVCGADVILRSVILKVHTEAWNNLNTLGHRSWSITGQSSPKHPTDQTSQRILSKHHVGCSS